MITLDKGDQAGQGEEEKVVEEEDSEDDEWCEKVLYLSIYISIYINIYIKIHYLLTLIPDRLNKKKKGCSQFEMGSNRAWNCFFRHLFKSMDEDEPIPGL